MLRTFIAFLLFPSLALAGGGVCINQSCINNHAKVVAIQTQFATPIGVPIAYQGNLYAVPVATVATPAAVSYGGTQSTQYKQTTENEQWEKMKRIEAKLDALLSDAVASGRVSGAMFASVNQATINQFCVGCHTRAEPSEGKGFALTDLSQLTADQHKTILARVMTKDESRQMPPVKSVQRKTWNGEAAGALLEELARTPAKSDAPANVSVQKPQ